MRLSYPLKASRETQLDVVARKSLHGSSRSFTDPSTSFSSSPGEFDNSSSLALSRFSTGGGTVDLPCYEMDEITFGETLGQGGYAIVDAIVRFPPFSKKDCDYRYRLTRTSDTGEKEYALKRLRDKDFRSVSLAVVDMATEAWLLRQLRHPNIIRLYAVVNDTRYDQNQALVLDRLHRTLHEQRRIWRKRAQRYKQSHSPGPSTRLERLEVTKMEVAVQLSSAILYLHKHRLCHRDIKPGNVGFDAVRAIDVSLIREPRTQNDY
jgi:serine/threonine protein kinase